MNGDFSFTFFIFLILASIGGFCMAYAENLEKQNEKEKDTVKQNTSKEDKDNYFDELYKTMIINTSKFNELIKKYQTINYGPTDTELISNLKKMETITEAIINEVERDESTKEPKLRLARDFINYYQSKSIYFLDALCNLISSGVENSKFENTIRLITKTLYDFGNEYEKQYCKIMEIEIAKIESEIKVINMNETYTKD